MPVRYITVTPQVDLFLPATQSFGDVAIVGAVDTTAQGPKKIPIAITNPLAVSSPSVSLTTNAATAAGNATLHFAAVPSSILPGMTIVDRTTQSVIPAGTTVQSTTATNIVMNQNATGAGVGTGDLVQFTNPNNGKPVDDAG